MNYKLRRSVLCARGTSCTPPGHLFKSSRI